ncbi:VOC family protein [Geminocystis sp. NIES-3709]|uniref:VOC family protein n=1 Tax=Geminocystis sp. NIES-3709 TaxID=1617448 RepID=UPI0005FCD2AF|nr:VOC family protein [Geminocystis sp. NIES-3709]BAQ66954.1 probable dioxygenase [Geminocystis sp. NIES-3709]
MKQIIFHLAFPISDITQTEQFYVEGLGCKIGRKTANAIILDFYGHQIVGHITTQKIEVQKGVYPRHFGLVFTNENDFETLLKIAEEKQLKFYQSPKRRFTDTPVEHRSFFLEDPFSNLLEFKFYCHSEAIFGSTFYAQIGDR